MRAVYDHADDQPGSRRGQVADWGVGDELFDHLPRRRFDRRDGHEAARAGDEVRVGGGHEAVRGDRGREIVAADRPNELVGADRPNELVGADRPTEIVATDYQREPAPVGGRRTVKINGRPGERHASYVARRRPPRTVGERLGTQPDRIAYWAFALGMLLIAVAIATSQI
jgi:hypothetical protein